MGLSSEHEHVQVAKACLKTTKAVFLVGSLMKEYVLPYLRKHNHEVSWHASALEAAKACERMLIVGDLVLIKGSQNTIFLETATEYLMRHKDKAQTLLCRQTTFWQQVRNRSLKLVR
jgi:UDP-N-acetylmuramyl pentapeptide synthase